MFTGALQTIEVKLAAAGALPWTAEAVDTALVVTPTNGATNGTTAVTVIAASKGFLKSFLLRNNDSVVHTLTIQLNDNGTVRPVLAFSLAIGDMVVYDATNGWRVFDASGKLKTLSSGDWLVNSDNSVSLSGRAAKAAIVTLTDAATIAVNLALGNFFTVTLGGSRTLGNPTNMTLGQSGCIFIVQDGTGSKTLAYDTYWDFEGGSAPTASTTANAVDRLDWVVRTSTSIHAVLTKDWK